MVTKEGIENFIDLWIAREREAGGLADYWRKSLVGFLSCENSGIPRLRELVKEDHFMPEELLEGARSVLCFFLPFKAWLGESNLAGELASQEWADAYKWTNDLAIKLGEDLVEYLEGLGHRAAYPYEALVFSQSNPKSRWSHRHLAYFAGMGSFGINNLLISERGSMGRYFSLVTDIEVENSEEVALEHCLYKKDKSCRICIDRCEFSALSLEGFNRHSCLSQLNINKKKLGSSVCGKCAVALPCSFGLPG